MRKSRPVRQSGLRVSVEACIRLGHGPRSGRMNAMIFRAAVVIGVAAACRGAAPDAVDEALRARPSGVCVIVGAGDGATAARAAEGGRRLVHVLEADPAKLAAARKLLESRKLTGLAVVEPWTGAALPYAENLVNLLIA